MKGLIIYNFQYRNVDVWKKQIEDYVESFRRVDIDLYPMDHVSAYLNLIERKIHVKFVIFYDKDFELARMFEYNGIKVFNSIKGLEICDDKAETYIKLRQNNIPTPPTYIIPNFYYSKMKNYFPEVEYCLKFLDFSYPLILKSRRSSFGEGVFLVKDREEFEGLIKANANDKFIVQEFIYSNNPKEVIDFRLIVVKNKVVCGVKRTNKNDFRCNSQYGSTWSKLKIIPLAMKASALKVAKKFNLLFCAVDFVQDSRGCYVIDVNSNMLTQKINEVCDINVTDIVAKEFKKLIL